MAEPISFWVPAALIGALSLPLALGLVPPNRIYGVRTPATLSDPRLWKRANRFGGLALIAASAVSLSCFRLHPELASGRSIAGLAVLLVPLAVALGAIALRLRRPGG